MTNPPQEERPAIRCVDRAIRVLKLLSGLGDCVELGTIAQRIDLPKSTLVRILKTLRLRGIVQQDAESHCYRLGPSLIRLAHAAMRQTDVKSLVLPFLEDLAEITGETASYAVRVGNHATYLTQALSSRIIRGVPMIGASLELSCTGVGKVLLSSFDREELEYFLRAHGFRKHTHKTVVTSEQLRRELVRIARRGYAFDDEEVELGKRCIAAPIHDCHGATIAAISITGPTERIRIGRVEKLAQSVMNMAERIGSAFTAEGIEA